MNAYGCLTFPHTFFRQSSIAKTELFIFLPISVIPMTTIIPNIFRDLTALGGATFYALLVLLVLLLGEYRLALLLILGFLLTMIIVIGIRLFYFKPRPQKQEYHTFLERIDASSYPSWHTARAFFLALVFIDIYGGVLLTGY